jgi:hypothetical protein
MTLGEKVQSILANLYWLTDEELDKLEKACGAELQERLRAYEQAEGRGKPSGANTPAPAAPHSLDGSARVVKCASCAVEIDPQAAWSLDDGRRVCRWCIEEVFKSPELKALSRLEDGEEEVPF